MAIEKQLASKINSISPYALSEAQDRLLSLVEQRDLQNEVLAWTGNKAIAYKPYIVSLTGEEFEISRISSSPVILRHADIDHIFKRHAQDVGVNSEQALMSIQELIANLNRLPEELAENVLAFDDPEKDTHLCIVLGEKSRGGNELIAVANVEKEISHTSVVNIITVHGRNDLFDRIEKAVILGKNIYVNERTDGWIKSSQEKPGEITNRLLELYNTSDEKINTFSVFDLESALPDGYHWTPSYGKKGAITGACLYAPDGEHLVAVDFRTREYRNFWGNEDWQPTREGWLLKDNPDFNAIAWDHESATSNTLAADPTPEFIAPDLVSIAPDLVSETPEQPKVARPMSDKSAPQPNKSAPGPKSAKPASPLADAKAASTQAQAHSKTQPQAPAVNVPKAVG